MGVVFIGALEGELGGGFDRGVCLGFQKCEVGEEGVGEREGRVVKRLLIDTEAGGTYLFVFVRGGCDFF